MRKPYTSLGKLQSAIENYEKLKAICPLLMPRLRGFDTASMTLEYETLGGHAIRTGQDLIAAASTLGHFQNLWSEARQSTICPSFAAFANGDRTRVYNAGYQGCADEKALSPDAFSQLISVFEAISLYKDSNVTNFIALEDGVRLVDFDTVTLAPLEYDLAKLMLTYVISGFDFSMDLFRRAIQSFDRSSGALPVSNQTLLSFMNAHWVMIWPFAAKNNYVLKWPAIRDQIQLPL